MPANSFTVFAAPGTGLPGLRSDVLPPARIEISTTAIPTTVTRSAPTW
jgi:hypothetical protein